MRIIDGKKIAAHLRAKFKEDIKYLEQNHVYPGLAVILVGDNAASQIYVRNKVKYCQEIGIHSQLIEMPIEISEEHLITKINHLNNDSRINGILVQLPLPPHINVHEVINAIDPAKDVDGFNSYNIGKLVTNQECLIPCTPLGCTVLLKSLNIELEGKKAVIIGKSNIVGKPMAQMLLRENCTVTIVHSKSKNIPEECRTADIIIAAAGSPRLVKKDWIKPGAIIIDVGISRIHEHGEEKIVGDVDFENVKEIAGAITPVPGGVGPMTIACLLYNTIYAAAEQRGMGYQNIFEMLEF